MLLENLFAEYLLECQIRKFTPKTIRGYKNCIDLLVRYCKEKHGITDAVVINLYSVCKERILPYGFRFIFAYKITSTLNP